MVRLVVAERRRSTYDPGPPPYKRATYTIEPWGGDGMKVIYDMVHPRGGVTHLEWQGRMMARTIRCRVSTPS